MTDIVKMLREFAGPNYLDDISGKQAMAEAADEIESLRSALGRIIAQAQKVLPRELRKQKQKQKRDKEVIPLWEKYAKAKIKSKHPKKFAFECIDGITPEQNAFFGHHKMTARAWKVVMRAKLLDYDAFAAVPFEQIRLADNVGISTVCEIAGLRLKILNQHDKETV